MFDILLVGSGVLWTVTYLLIIRRGFLDHTYGMPLVAFCANLSWEFIFSFVFPHGPVQRPVNIVWFSLDLIILYQLLHFGPREFPRLPKRHFYGMVALALLTAFFTVVSITLEFEDFDGAYSAFGQNLMMSVLYIVMLYSRGSLRGQSLSIALTKTGARLLPPWRFSCSRQDTRGRYCFPSCPAPYSSSMCSTLRCSSPRRGMQGSRMPNIRGAHSDGRSEPNLWL